MARKKRAEEMRLCHIILPMNTPNPRSPIHVDGISSTDRVLVKPTESEWTFPRARLSTRLFSCCVRERARERRRKMSLAAISGLVSEGSSLITRHEARTVTVQCSGGSQKGWDCLASVQRDLLVTDLMPRGAGRKREETEVEMLDVVH